MDPRRAQTERNMLPEVGPRFYREGGVVLFRFVIDPGNVLGPRPATRGDRANHPGAWAAFCAADDVSALDRDATGEDGGSLPSESPAAVVVEEPVFTPVDAGGEAPPVFVAEPPRQKRKYTRRKVAA